MEEDDPQTEALRKQFREELGTATPEKKRGMSPFEIVFTTLCLLTPFALYLVFVYQSHEFKNFDEFFRWLGQCVTAKCK